MKREMITGVKLAITLCVLAAMPATGYAVDFFLRAEQITVNYPDGSPAGRDVPMWGFALDSAFGAGDGTVTVPGPQLTVPVGDNTVNIHVDNNLSVPISIVIPGQKATMTPVKYNAPAGDPEAIYNGRVRSFTHETAPGNIAAVTYTWTSFRAGTFLYHSGTTPAVQVQMGLYGSAKKDTGASQAYGTAYNNELTLLYSEVDPALHDAVAGGTYGPLGTMTSTVKYKPLFFLINGAPHKTGDLAQAIGTAGQTLLIRFVNAGLKTHSLILRGHYMTCLAEDGYAYTNRPLNYALMLPALKTKDVLVTLGTAGTYAVFDRALFLTNGTNVSGGMLKLLEVQ